MRIVERGYGADGVKMQRVQIDGIYAAQDLKGTVLDFTAMREDDFLEDVKIHRINYEGTGPVLQCNPQVRNDISIEGGVSK